jgi:peptide deformylase
VGGAGLSAPQVGVSRNAITLRVTKVEHASDCAIHSPPATCNCKPKAGSELVYLVNPEVTFQSEDKQPSTEGCLSFPGLYFPMERPKVVRVSALGYDGAPFEIGGDGLLAAALMHEIDHLNGVLIIDSASRLKYDLVKRKLTRLKGKKNLRYKTPEEAALETARKAQQ